MASFCWTTHSCQKESQSSTQHLLVTFLSIDIFVETANQDYICCKILPNSAMNPESFYLSLCVICFYEQNFNILQLMSQMDRKPRFFAVNSKQ